VLHDYLISVIRTAVPAGVGAVLVWAASALGVVIDSESSTALTAVVVAVAVAGYYAIVRALETRWPMAGRLLGRKSAPTYGGNSTPGG